MKVRAWDIEGKCWIPQGQFAIFADGRNQFLSYNEDTGYFCFDEIEIITEQFTGLHDKNGKEIYEGDIIDVETGEYHILCRYNESDGCFEYIDPWDELFDTLGGYDGCYSVIGNVHENPELLEKS